MLSSIFHGNGTLTEIDENEFINSAVAVFCKKGYSNTDFSDLAHELNVSESVIRSQYEDKESLFMGVCEKVLKQPYNNSDSEDPVKVLNGFIDFLRAEVFEQTVYAEVLSLLICSRDLPETAMVKLVDIMTTSGLGKAFKHAQNRGFICGGNIKDIMIRFISSSYTIMNGYVKAGLAIPENDVFLSIISFKETPDVCYDKETIKQQNSVIAAFASDFQNILFVDLDTDKIDVYQGEDEDPWVEAIAHRGFNEYTKQYSEKYVAPEEKSYFLREMSPDNIKQRLDEEPIYYVEHKLLMNGEMVPYQTKIVLDPMYAYGNKVLVGSHRVYK